MKTAAIVFPHQLFNSHPAIEYKPELFLTLENSLFFYDSKTGIGFHRQKLCLHLASMQAYQEHLEQKGFNTQLVSYNNGRCELNQVCNDLSNDGFEQVVVADPHDFLLEKRLKLAVDKSQLALTILPSPAFINTSEDNQQWRATRKRWHMADFYQWQRKRLNILMDGDKPVGGEWSYDKDNRKKLPLKQLSSLPIITSTNQNNVAAINNRIDQHFSHRFGQSGTLYYPTTHKEAESWLDDFLAYRFIYFGHYEDAIEEGQNWLYHSILTPMLNIGLLEPQHVVNRALLAAREYDVPLNSVEGFIRQIIGWREFMRATYSDIGVSMRTSNHWQHTRPMPAAFYTASTGILPVDNAIERVLETGYCHHIERLMVLGGFMFLCEIHPQAIYKWYMEMFVDSYDWVMVPNVYAMSQHADGGSITTKPYFSGSNYIIKMSHYKKGEWSEIWDALFWRWVIINKSKLEKNYRWAMMCKNVEKMEPSKQQAYLSRAERFVSTLN